MLKDIQIALRLLRKSKALTAIAILSIALSVGAPAVIFTGIKAVLLDPLPYRDPGQLVQIRTDSPKAAPSHGDWVYPNDANEIDRRNHSFQSLGIYGNAVLDLAGDPSHLPEALYGLKISASLFPTLGVAPMLGRNIEVEEDQPNHSPVVILSHGLWTRRFQSDAGIVGKTITLNGRASLVIGVMPPGFDFPLRREATRTPVPYVDFWTSFRQDPASLATSKGAASAVARLRPGVSLPQAAQDVAAIGEALAVELPGTNRGRILNSKGFVERTTGEASRALKLMFAGTILFLLIGCANVANLLLARGLARRHEISIRMAIGAGRTRIVRQLLTESCVLALLGGLAGFAITAAAWTLLPAVAPRGIPRLANAHVDGTTLTFAMGIALINGLLFGIIPALRSAKTVTPQVGARDSTRNLLVGAEIAVTVTLAVIGGQLLGNFLELLRTDPGFEADRIVAAVVLPPAERYPSTAQRGTVYKKFLEAVRAIPGVESAGTVDALPFSGENHGGYINATSDPSSQSIAEVDVVGGEYLQAMGVRLLEGRWFHDGDAPSSAIVSDSLARRLWPESTAIGRRLCVNCTPENPGNWTQIVGVVTTVHHASLDRSKPAESVYISATAMQQAAFIVARTNHPAADIGIEISRAIASVDPLQPVLLSASMRSLVSDTLSERLFIATLLAITGVLALFMSAAGVYGVTAYTTSRRHKEIGIRLALGATAGSVKLLVLWQGMKTITIGLAIGLVSSLAATRLLRGSVAGLETSTAMHTAEAVALVALAALFACWIPACRSSSVDPMRALNSETR